jgi:2-oxoglutarate ferredoxin oxidoreductase subunit alpha
MELNIMVAGEAGLGINASSLILSKCFSRGGLNVFMLTENPNTIKGLHNWCTIRVSEDKIFSQSSRVDLLLALNRESVVKHKDEVSKDGILVFDKEEIKPEGLNFHNARVVSIPLNKITNEMHYPKLMQNIVAIGGILALIGYEFDVLEDLLKEMFLRKGEEVVASNVNLAIAGYNYVKTNIKECSKYSIKKTNLAPKMFLTGNESLSLGAIKAGAKFLSAYPMTPSSPILHYIASKEREYNIVVKHAEDEISAINMAIGANFAGVRGFVCTSGGGFSLMVEALGLAAMSETPLVVVEGQRPGPSTGQPTHTAQGDLKFLLNASQGEFPRIVIAPGDNNECFYETFNAFNLAEKFQVPVLILTDKYLGESYMTTSGFNTDKMEIDRGKLLNAEEISKIPDYKRYEDVLDGVSFRSIPSYKGGIHRATSYEHDEYGFYDESPSGVTKMMDKRFKKTGFIESYLSGKKTKFYGDEDSDITFISWGSTKGPILDALNMLKKDGIKANFLQIVYLDPFPVKEVDNIIYKAKITIDVENNKQAQLASLIKEKTGKNVHNNFLKYDGQAFYSEDIYKMAKEVF